MRPSHAPGMGRRDFIRAAGGFAAGAAVFADVPADHSARTPAFRIVTSPRRVFRRTSDFNRNDLSGWSCYLVVQCSDATPVVLESLTVTHLSTGRAALTETFDAAAIAAMNFAPPPPPSGAYNAGQFRLASMQPSKLGVDRIRVDVAARGVTEKITHEFPIETFTQKTSLIFPFRGRGLITQGGELNDGHRNASGMFAVDAIGLSETYAMMLRDSDDANALTGWGRPVIAPAGGVIVVARRDRPDQPRIGNADPALFVPEFPEGGDPGNHVVIDHENGEFSMIAHMQNGSVRVGVGDRVSQGDTLGVLGNSGDTTAPHVHHQLQSGAQWTRSDGFPHYYVNGPGRRHDRGETFNAR